MVLAVFVVITLIHLFLQFLAWSYTPGNIVPTVQKFPLWQPLGWPVLSFPAFWLVTSHFSTRFFWGVFVLNSLIWGIVVSTLVLFLRKLLKPLENHS